MSPHLHVFRVAGCVLCADRRSLDTGPFCAACGVHRAMSAGGLCPGCIADKRTSKEAS